MNTQRVKILLTAIDKGSLTGAGQALGYTQSYLTQAMKAFEEEVGFPLLVKTNRGVEPTKEAQALMPVMRRLIRCEEQFEQEKAELMGLHKGTIRIGTYVSTSVYWVPQIIEYFQSNYPDVVFQIEELGHDEMISGVASGVLDIALMSDPG
ncbi:MAG: LysR family transcriptional regulator, partial [Mogibacterium sp.]|nr:LysR family transcriptional regulator [Mogibacterium sp.]